VLFRTVEGTSVGLKNAGVSGTAALVLAGSLSLSGLAASAQAHGGMDGHLMTGPTGNKVEMVDPAHSSYVPKLARASAADRAKAQRLLNGVNRFCRTHSAAGLTANWRPGRNLSSPTHYFNPRPSRGLRPASPRAALIYHGELGGVMFTGVPLPSLGSIPRAHSHDMSRPIEMLHVYCTRNLKDAFTPNRMLGVKADIRALRLRIRPAVMDLSEAQLRAVRATARDLAGNRLRPVTPTGTAAGSGPDPVLQAMRTEIRRSLMILSEPQLRRVWSMVRSA